MKGSSNSLFNLAAYRPWSKEGRIGIIFERGKVAAIYWSGSMKRWKAVKFIPFQDTERLK
jgi:hypothetical protein